MEWVTAVLRKAIDIVLSEFDNTGMEANQVEFLIIISSPGSSFQQTKHHSS